VIDPLLAVSLFAIAVGLMRDKAPTGAAQSAPGGSNGTTPGVDVTMLDTPHAGLVHALAALPGSIPGIEPARVPYTMDSPVSSAVSMPKFDAVVTGPTVGTPRMRAVVRSASY
jgi:hypothetical protein